jgi:fructokinase
MSNFNIVGIGEVLWDVLPEGKELGGAPANFSFHTKNLGADSTIISAVGDDNLGEELKTSLSNRNLNYVLNYSTLPTGTVSVGLADGIPDYVIHEPVAWDDISLETQAISVLKKANAICFGTLAQRTETSRQTIQRALKLAGSEAIKVYDINLRQHYYSRELIENSLRCADILKLNSEELIILSGFFNLSEMMEAACTQLLLQFDLNMVALTNGGENSILLSHEEISVFDSPKVKVVDTVGAGDAFTSALVIGLLRKNPLSQIHRYAVHYAAQVCMHQGAMPVIPISE